MARWPPTVTSRRRGNSDNVLSEALNASLGFTSLTRFVVEVTERCASLVPSQADLINSHLHYQAHNEVIRRLLANHCITTLRFSMTLAFGHFTHTWQCNDH